MLIHNTFGIKTNSRKFINYKSEEELKFYISLKLEEPILHVGAGSNLVFTHDLEGTVLHSNILYVCPIHSDKDHVLIRVGSGIIWDDFVAYALANGWSGVENLSFIPGEVGASAVQNIGAYGVEAKDFIESVECVNLKNGEKRIFFNQDCKYDYRSSIFKHELRGIYAVTYVTYRLNKQFIPQLEYGNISSVVSNYSELSAKTIRKSIIEIRNNKLPDPSVLGNAGSFFMNPIVSWEQFYELKKHYPQIPFYETSKGVKIHAGWLIEQCGWKGKRIGNVGVYEHQALILVNYGGASGKEVINLCDAIQNDVRKRFGIELIPEANIIR